MSVRLSSKGWPHSYKTALHFSEASPAAPLFTPIAERLGATIGASHQQAASPSGAGAEAAPRWPLRQLIGLITVCFGRRLYRETIRSVLHRLALSWAKAKKRLGRADRERGGAFISGLSDLLKGAVCDRYLLGYGWAPCGEHLWEHQARPGSRPSCPSMASISTTKGTCASGPIRVPVASTSLSGSPQCHV